MHFSIKINSSDFETGGNDENDCVEICKILDKSPGKYIKDIYNDLEFKIVNNYLLNEKEVIKNYIKENYMN